MSLVNVKYFKEIDGVPFLSAEEEKELLAKAAKGDIRARNKLVSSNLKFVVKMAHKYEGMGLDIEDLVAEGNFGLIKAVEKFNPKKNARLITYAAWWIMDSIQKAIRENGTGVKLPAGKYKEMKNWNTESFDEVLGSENDASLYEYIEDRRYRTPEEECIRTNELERFHDCFAKLSEKEQAVLENRYGLKTGECMSLAEVGNTIGLSKERARQLEIKALSTMCELLAG